MFTIAKAPGIYTDANLVVDSATGSDPSSEGVETGLHRGPSHQARGHTTTSRFLRLRAPVQKLATTLAGTTAAFSPVAMAADPAVSSFGMGHVVAFAAGSALILGIQSLRARFAARHPAVMLRMPTATSQVASVRVAAAPVVSDDFEMKKQAALSRVLPSLDGVEILAEAKPVALPAGEFTMGNRDVDKYHAEGPAHRVVVPAFYMMERAVSNGLFRQFRASHHSDDGFDGENQPVVNIDHGDAMDFADWMNENHGVAGMKWRLPTEAEMEYAMRGKGQRATDVVAPDRVNVCASGHGKTLDVDSEAHKNNYGLIHIRGNVREWCSSHFAPYSAEVFIRSIAVGLRYDKFILRGGSYNSDGDGVRLAHRDYDHPYHHCCDIGFRLVLAFKDE